MFPYIIILLIPIFWWILSKHRNYNYKNGMPLCLLILFLISSFRSQHIGEDYSRYIYFFNFIGRTGDAYFREKGYVILNHLIYKLSHKHYVFSMGINLSLFVPFYFFIKSNVNKNYWPLCIFIFVSNPYMYVQTTFNILRQCSATGIVLIATHLVSHKSFFKRLFGILAFILALQFHRAVIFIMIFIIPLLLKIKWNTKNGKF